MLVSGSISLSDNVSIGQTFTARFDGLESIYLHLTPTAVNPAIVSLQLFTAPDDVEPLRRASISSGDFQQPGYFRFHFDPIPDSDDTDFYLALDADGAGEVLVGSGPGDAYIDGALYINGEPADSQLAFMLDYDAPQLAVGFLAESLAWIVWLLAAALVFVIPGWALLQTLWPGWSSLSWAEKLGLAGGSGLALYPVLLTLTHLVNLPLGRLYPLLPAAAGLLWLLFNGLRHFNRGDGWSLTSLRPRASQAGRLSLVNGDILLVLVIGLVVFTRLWAVRDLDYPLWHDSYEHTMIVQLIYDHGGLFRDWSPYIPYHGLTAHYGFHTQAAAFGWLGGHSAVQATLIFGQLINIFALLSLMPLAIRLGRGSRFAGAGALIAAGLVSLMPAYYVNWGRFPQLSGQAILPVALWMSWDLLDKLRPPAAAAGSNRGARRRNLAAAIWLGAILAGMALAYYRMAFFYVGFMLAWLICWALPKYRLDPAWWKPALVIVLVISAVTLAVLAPQLLHTQGTWLSGQVGSGIAQPTPTNIIVTDIQLWRSWSDYVPQNLMIVAIAALALGVLTKRGEIPMLALWIGLVTAYYLGQLVQLPGANMLISFAILIALYIPAGLLAGFLTAEVTTWLVNRLGIWPAALMTALLLLAAAGEANRTRQITRPEMSALVTRPDGRALDWIARNAPEDARFLVEGYSVYGRSTAVGADAGWWISLLTGRENTMPPQYALMERPEPPEYTADLVALVNGLEDHSPTSPNALALLCHNRITHVYIGQRQGLIGHAARQLFEPADFLNQPGFSLVYQQDRVYIFAVQPGVCPD